VTGRSELLYENRDYVFLITDSDFRLDSAGASPRTAAPRFSNAAATTNGHRFMTVPIGDLDGTRLLDFSADGETLYMLDTRDRDKAALVADRPRDTAEAGVG